MSDAIEIMELREAGEDAGGLMGYYCKGHVDRYEFARLANDFSGAFTSYDIRHVEPDQVHHVWWRTVPLAGEPGQFQFVPTAGQKQGAWAATVCESVTNIYMVRSRRIISEFDRGRLNGISEGINWALQWLETSEPDLAAKMLSSFRMHRNRVEKGSTS